VNKQKIIGTIITSLNLNHEKIIVILNIKYYIEGEKIMKKVIALVMTTMMMGTMVGCGSSNKTAEAPKETKSLNVCMVTDTGGVSDQSFNQSSWEGLQSFEKKSGAKVSYLESKQETDYATNLDKAVDADNKLIWGIGFAMADAVSNAAQANKDVSYAIVDNSYGDKTPDNVTGVTFRAQEPSFIVGYIAARTTKADRVGFVGGIKSPIIDQFQYGQGMGKQIG
jgi:basic membrane protein A